MNRVCLLVLVTACGGGGSSSDAQGDSRRFEGGGANLGGCAMFPANHIFNTPIDDLPVDPNSAAYITTIGATRKIHLDLGTTTDQSSAEFYGIPYNLVAANALTWPTVQYTSPDPNYDWSPTDESDCADGSKAIVSPCTIGSPHLPFPASPIVEGGLSTAADHQPDGDHHLLVLDTDTCRLWEGYHVYRPGGTYQIFGSATFDLKKTEMRPSTWTSADAAGFPILPLLIRGDEASAGQILHPLRFTIQTSKIRDEFIWPATHQTNGPSETQYPPMGQLFRLKASFTVPSTANTQTRAILTALKTYGMYLADGGSDMYISGTPDASWEDATFATVQAVAASEFEAVDITAITKRSGWSATSAAVP
jgi:hypothetical protein